MTQTVIASTSSSHELQDRIQSITREPIPEQSAPAEAKTKTPVAKLITCAYSFFISGVNDGTLGPLIPYVLSDFDLGTSHVAFMYMCTFLGWLVALPVNPLLGKFLTLGQVLCLGAVLQLLAQLMRPWGPFPLYATSFFLCAFGMALQDSYSNTFVTSVGLAHRWLGLIHASYAAGLAVAPLVATAIASKGGAVAGMEPWRATYFVVLGIDALNAAAVVSSFSDTLFHKISGRGRESEENSKVAMLELKESLKSKALWLISISFFLQLGAMMTTSGWVVEFLVSIRGGDLSSMGFVPTGYNLGVLLGRLLLAEPIHRFGEHRMILLSFVLVIAFHLIFWLVPNIIGSATALSLMGFFSGSFIPVGISIASKLFPRKIRSAALGVIFVLAQAGGAVFPSVTGLVAQRASVSVLQPIVLALLVLAGIFWWTIPKVPEDTSDKE